MLLLVAAALTSCDAALCGSDLIQEVASPDGRYIAAVFERDCGAATPYVSVVSLRPGGVVFDPDDKTSWVFAIHGQSHVKVVWLGDNRIELSYSGMGEPAMLREQTWRGIHVSHE